MRGNPAIIIASLFICSFISQFSFAQQKFNYDKEWSIVDSLITKKGLTTSAMAEVNKIYAAAKKEKNDAQVIKSLLYKMNLQEVKEENAEIKNIHDLEKEIIVSGQPSMSILKSILAEAYRDYLEQHRNQLYDRTETVGFKKEDIATWGTEDLHKKITALYLESISNEKLLQQTKLEPFDPIIIKGNVRQLRPTLFDLLAHRALNYFKNDERYINKPEYEYEINETVAFADARNFVAHRFLTADSLSLHHKALLLFQRLLSYHFNDALPAALIDVDIERLSFVHGYGTMANKDSLYEQALQQLASKYKNEKESTEALYLIAEFHANLARAYDPIQDTTHRFDLVTAREICESVVTNKDSSEGKANCQALLEQILQKKISLQVEKVNLPGKPFRMLVTYKNASVVFFRLIRLDKSVRDSMDNSWRPEFWKWILSHPVIKTFSNSVPQTNDHQTHRVEIKIDALPVGEYALLSSNNEKFSDEGDQPLSIEHFYVSNLAYINNGNDYFILSREEGRPLENVELQIWERKYDYQKGKYAYAKNEKFTSDKNGYVKTNSKTDLRQANYLQLELTGKNDHLFIQDGIYLNRERDESSDTTSKEVYEEDNRKVFLFTDRSIYRPGQVVYFKGLLVTRDFETKKFKIVPATKTKVFLHDTNGEEVDSIELRSNEFGSYSGKFHIPENRLTGEFNIEDDEFEGQLEFSVEEYKRPKFEVEFEKQKGSYRLYDSIIVRGNAKAYAGNTIENAIVKYRVVRETRFPYPWLFWKNIWPRTEEKEIAHGEVKTGNDGKFDIRFVAIPDKSVDKVYQPTFQYRVIADVTDINGETRNGVSTVSVGYQSMQISLTLPQQTMPADSLKQVFVSTTNLADEFVPVTVTLTMWKLDAPNRLIRNRYWAQPDQFVMSQDEYLKYFPNDEYSDETRKETWKRVQRIIEQKDSSNRNSKFEIRNTKFLPGWYAVEVSAIDKFGDSLRDLKFIQLTNSKTGEPVVPSYNWVQSNYLTREPGDTAIVKAGSSAEDVFVIESKDGDGVELQKGELAQYDFLQLSNQEKNVILPISESNRGSVGVSLAFVKNNRFYTYASSIMVPWTNKELKILYETYRDKTLPGSEEKWKIKLIGYKSERVAAEVMTSMYDASLDQFKHQQWDKPDIWTSAIIYSPFSNSNNFDQVSSTEKYQYPRISPVQITYDALTNSRLIKQQISRNENVRYMKLPTVQNADAISDAEVTYAFSTARKSFMASPVMVRGEERTSIPPNALIILDGEVYTGNLNDLNPAAIQEVVILKSAEATSLYGSKGSNGAVIVSTKAGMNNKPEDQIQVRKNFNETAFFFPELRTDTAGNVEFSFTMPEALTQWKWMTLAHTKDLAFGYSEKNIVTQKELMLQPNLPRFLREGDIMEISTKIVNVADSEVTGQVQLQLIDATTNESVDGWFQNMYSNQYFTAPAKGSVPAQFSVQIPHLYNKPVIVRLIARAGNVSDGEENVLPVLTNRVLVTETLPLNVRGSGTKEFKLDKLIKSGGSETLQHHALTVEFTSNPAWYAVQALPYLMEFPYECAEQVWNRFYANALATKMVNASPKIKQIFEKWKTLDTAALLSNLQKNQELKSVLLQETPWVMEAKSESEQKKRIALLFDMVRMSSELSKNFDQLLQMQSPNGGFVWFKGGPDDRYITQYLISGLGHLKILDAIPASLKNKIDEMTKSGINYLDGKIKEDYDRLVKSKVDLTKQQPGYEAIQYLYMRSFFNAQAVSGNIFQAYNYYRKQSQLFWLQQNRYMQGMIALALFRTGDGKTSNDILRSLKQNAIVSEEMGMYWKENSGGYYWHQAPIETQSVLIEAFATIYKDNKIVDDLKTWLLKNKQTNNWNTTKATADACYALLLQGTDWLVNTPVVHIKLGDKSISSTEHAEAGTGYFKKTYDGPFVNSSMGNISVSVAQPINQSTSQPINTTWGSVYWQYFENAENITASATPLSIVKRVFVERNTDRGPVIEPIGDHAALKVGDKVKIRIELRVDRDMEYVHMKDMRASAFEPVNVLSSYKWQGGLGYYESPKDASTNFFFSSLPKGTYVFEYSLFASQVGTFSNGITTIQCMYAPEFTSHSEGIKVTVE